MLDINDATSHNAGQMEHLFFMLSKSESKSMQRTAQKFPLLIAANEQRSKLTASARKEHIKKLRALKAAKTKSEAARQ